MFAGRLLLGCSCIAAMLPLHRHTLASPPPPLMVGILLMEPHALLRCPPSLLP
jgi:hypothetical protein